jgi:hypothetical protein
MRKLLPFILLLGAGAAIWYFAIRKEDKPPEPKQQPLAVSRHSAGFNQSVNSVLDRYYALSEVFVTWDSSAVGAASGKLMKGIDSLKLEELKKDTSSIFMSALVSKDLLKKDLEEILRNASLENKRRSFHSLTNNLYDFLRVVRYDGAPVYLHECGMAFNDTETAIWLDKAGDQKRRNPYLGLYHPRYHAAMLDCGETKDSLKFDPGK